MPKCAKKRARQKKAREKCEEEQYQENLYFLNSPNSPYNQIPSPRPNEFPTQTITNYYVYNHHHYHPPSSLPFQTRFPKEKTTYQPPYQPKQFAPPRYFPASNHPNIENNTDTSPAYNLPSRHKYPPPPRIPKDRFQEKNEKAKSYNALPETLPISKSRNKCAAISNNFSFDYDDVNKIISKDVVWDLFLWPLMKGPFKSHLEAESLRKKESILTHVQKRTVTCTLNIKKKRLLDEELEDIAKLNDGWVRKERHPRKPLEIRLRKRKIC